MIIKDKINKILDTYTYNFIGVDFTLYGTELIRIYDKVDGVCLYSGAILLDNDIPEELANSEYKKEELIKMEDHKFAFCFYLDAPEKIEKPISARARYI